MGGLAFSVDVLLGVIFLYSGLAKLRVGHFAADLDAYRVLPSRAIRPLAITMPWIEIVVGGGLVFGVAAPLMLWPAIVLLAAFSLAMSVNLVRGRRVACGCQGTSSPISWRLVGRNLVLIGFATVAAVLAPPIPGLRALAGLADLRAQSALALTCALILAAIGLRLAVSTRHIRRRALDTSVPTVLGGAP